MLYSFVFLLPMFVHFFNQNKQRRKPTVLHWKDCTHYKYADEYLEVTDEEHAVCIDV